MSQQHLLPETTDSVVQVYVFSSKTCEPCALVKPVIDELHEQYSECVWTFVDIANDPQKMVAQFGVTSVPCMVVRRNDTTLAMCRGTQMFPYYVALKKATTQ
jgi:hypothetical protein